MYEGKLYVPKSQEMKNLFLIEMHNVPYVGHLRYQKTIVDIKGHYFWLGMKKYVDDYIAKYLKCQKLRAKHRHPTGLLHPLPIP
jgi:hypothetical protein